MAAHKKKKVYIKFVGFTQCWAPRSSSASSCSSLVSRSIPVGMGCVGQGLARRGTSGSWSYGMQGSGEEALSSSQFPISWHFPSPFPSGGQRVWVLQAVPASLPNLRARLGAVTLAPSLWGMAIFMACWEHGQTDGWMGPFLLAGRCQLHPTRGHRGWQPLLVKQPQVAAGPHVCSIITIYIFLIYILTNFRLIVSVPGNFYLGFGCKSWVSRR